MPLDVLETFCDLVRLPSVNPMGRDVQGDVYYEHRVTDYLQRCFQRMGVPWLRQRIAPGRDNILARFDGDRPLDEGGKLLMFEVHQDTVPVEGMAIEPWTPEVRDGRVYGRGACDVKGGMASMLAALARLVKLRPAGRHWVVLACSVDEEYGFSGATRIPQLWGGGGPERETGSATGAAGGVLPQRADRERGDGRFLPRAPDEVIVAEPTLLNVVVTHKGTVRWRLHTRGRAAHSSQPQAGQNAIYDMARVVAVLERCAGEIIPQLGEHPVLGRPSLSVGLIAGGISVNVVPDRCSIEMDRRILPGEDPQQAWQQVRDFLISELPHSVRLDIDPPHQAALGMQQGPNQPLAARVSRAAAEFGGPGQLIGVPYGTDAPAFASAGIPTVVFGPGDIAQAHTADEWIDVRQLRMAAEIYFRLALEDESGAGPPSSEAATDG